MYQSIYQLTKKISNNIQVVKQFIKYINQVSVMDNSYVTSHPLFINSLVSIYALANKTCIMWQNYFRIKYHLSYNVLTHKLCISPLMK